MLDIDHQADLCEADAAPKPLPPAVCCWIITGLSLALWAGGLIALGWMIATLIAAQ